MNKFKFILGFASVLASSLVQAVEYNQLQPTLSTLSFAYQQMGVPMESDFKKFTAGITFDPAKLSLAQARIAVDLASIDTGSTEADEEVMDKKWFNAAQYPLARFVSTGITSLGGDRYQAKGHLSIKGKTLDISAPVRFQTDGHKGVFSGSFNIKRLAYSIGEDEWTDLATVADDVQIKFKLVVFATPK